MAPEAPKRGKILFLTNPEPSESNIFLATMHAVLQLQPDAEIHCASFNLLTESVVSVVENLRQTVPETAPITFHELRGIPMKAAMNIAFSREGAPPRIPNYLPVSALKSPSFFNTTQGVRDIVPLFVPYNGPQLVEVFTSIVEVIKEVDADLIVVDTLMTAALTAVNHLNVRYVCLSPNSLKEFTVMAQPYGAALWKFPAGSESKVVDVLAKWIEADVVRIVEWFPADPNSILKTGHVVCTVHHGGANSYHEAVSSGVPQVVLPQWADTYDYAQRVEMFGIGRWGSRTAKPLWTAPEVSSAVLDVVIGEKSQEMKENAAKIRAAVDEKGPGGVNAARIILEECARIMA